MTNVVAVLGIGCLAQYVYCPQYKLVGGGRLGFIVANFGMIKDYSYYDAAYKL
jgi:hypothetical protein